MKNEFYAFLQSTELKQFAKTEKDIFPSLSNIEVLDDEEFSNLILNFINYLYASNVPIRITGICYLKLIYEHFPDRFKNHIFKCIECSGFSINSMDDYSDIDCMFIFCCFNLYKDFLIMELSSENQEIIEDVRKSFNTELIDYINSPWNMMSLKEN